MKSLRNIFIIVLMTGSLTSCFNEKKPNYQFMPNMYESAAYEAYSEHEMFENSQTAKKPVEGTIPRGWSPYEYEDSTEGLADARENLKNPLPVTQANLAAGSQLYTFYCSVCHGDTGDGKGILATREKFLGIPSYADPGRVLTEGSIYHVQMFGLNAMGSYTAQTNEEERWQITMHVENLMAELKGTPKKVPVDATSETDVTTETSETAVDTVATDNLQTEVEN